MKKILSLILAGLMTISCAAFVAADDAAAETAADPVQEAAIEFLEGYGIYKGGDGLTDEDPIWRYQMALFVARISTGWVDDYVWDYSYDWENYDTNNSTFTDLEGTPAADYLGAISYANQMGIIEGYSATKFGPTDGITYRDALTMVCRTLGYKNLAYPWGYIQTAVELGLTNGINAVYTEELTRGEVAVILYNAMFAETANGNTLAKEIFDVEFGWTNIMITATDEGYFPRGAADAKAVLGKTTVGFKVVDNEGNVSGDTYYVLAEKLGLENGHDAELALGTVYAALFSINDNDKFVEMKKAISLEGNPVRNNGITDDAAEPVSVLPITAFLSEYDMYSKYENGQYLTYLGDALYIYSGNVVNVDVWGVDYNRIAIDTKTGDIVVWNGVDENKNPTESNWTASGIDLSANWEVLWYYNATLNNYYRYEYSDSNDTIHVDWMTPAEFEKSYADAIKCITGTENLYEVVTDVTALKNNPYAKLRHFDADLDGEADIAIYKDYAIGYFANGSKTCNINAANVNHTNVKMPTYTISDLDSDKDLILNVDVFVEDGHAYHEAAAGYQFGWINVADGVIGFENEDGTYNNGVVLFDFNAVTGEIEIVKYIPEGAVGTGTDADSGYVYGVLQGYSTRNHYVTISGENYDFGYDSLVGGTLKYNSGKIVERKLNAEELDKYQMQYVKALIVDGLVVDVDTVGDTWGNDAMVVLSYAGVTSDGYIAVYAYSTVDGKLGVYKINSYNGWKQGDYRYYPVNAYADAAFAKGTIYEVISHDAGTDSYGVETCSIEEKAATGTRVTYEFDSGYRVTNGTSYTKCKTTDLYIIVTEDGTIYAYTGIAPDTYSVTGTEVVSGDRRVIYADADDVVGFTDNANDIGFVLYSKANGRVLEAAFDDAQGVDDYYLLGSTVSEVSVLDVLTGTWDTAFVSTNIDLVNGAYYMTVGNTIVDRLITDNNQDGIISTIKKYYKSGVEDLDVAKYIVLKDITIDPDEVLVVATADKAAEYKSVSFQIAEELGVIPEGKNPVMQKDIAAAYVPAANIVMYMVNADGEYAYTKTTALDAAKTYEADVIYDGSNTVVYLEEVAAE